ncbi:MAG: DNA-binding response regulator [Phycisphaeraceae bacterium]|nr:MAG: DNA-binding response regulator [Phycisphaeraceae bacterium]
MTSATTIHTSGTETAVRPVTVVIVDDHTMVRGGLRSILEDVEGIKVVGEAENGRDAIEMAAKYAPDILLLDVAMPGLNGVEAARKIRSADPKIKIIAVSMHSDERYVAGILDAGGRGYLLKTCDAAELIRAIHSVMRGKIYVTADLTHVLVNRMHGDASSSGASRFDTLTPREREVLQLIAEGFTSKEIGEKLGAAMKTVETHRTNLIRKLDIHSIAELTKYAIREGLSGLAE